MHLQNVFESRISGPADRVKIHRHDRAAGFTGDEFGRVVAGVGDDDHLRAHPVAARLVRCQPHGEQCIGQQFRLVVCGDHRRPRRIAFMYFVQLPGVPGSVAYCCNCHCPLAERNLKFDLPDSFRNLLEF